MGREMLNPVPVMAFLNKDRYAAVVLFNVGDDPMSGCLSSSEKSSGVAVITQLGSLI